MCFVASQQQRPRLRLSKDPLGYKLDGKLRRGFPDDADLTEAERRRIAAWAQALAPKTLTAAQEELLQGSAAPRSGARQRAEALASLEGSSFWRFLDQEERKLVRDPSGRRGLAGASYPLGISDLATLVNATVDQIRYWNDAGLVPARRSAGGQRQFFAAAAMRAFFLRKLGRSGIAILRKVRNREAGPLLVGIATVLSEEAASAPAADQSVLQSAATELEKVSSLS
jgi:hypothetical protein